MKIDWSKAPEGATHYMPISKTFCESWIKDPTSNGYYYMVIDEEDEGWAKARFSYPEAALSCLIAKQSQPVFTQSMADNKELPQVGMDCLFKKRGALEAGTVTAITKRFIIFTDSFGDEHVRKLDELTIEPIDTRTNKEKAVDSYIKSLSFSTTSRGKDNLSEAFLAGVKWVGE